MLREAFAESFAYSAKTKFPVLLAVVILKQTYALYKQGLKMVKP
jgi:hypothetical protein